MSASTNRFAEVLESLHAEGAHWRAQIGEDWLQGRTLFGGLQVALAVRALRRLPEVGALPLRVLQTTFIAPVAAGAVDVEVRVLRTGKSVVHAEARLMTGGQTGCLVVAVFGAARESRLKLSPPLPAVDPATPSGTEMFYIEGVTPAFTQHLRMQWADGALPFMGGDEARTRIFVSLRESARTGEAEVIAFADAIPSPALSLLKRPVPASSLTWTLELLTDQFDPAPEKPWLMDAEVSAGRDGYLCQGVGLWIPQGEAVAMSRQSVVVFG